MQELLKNAILGWVNYITNGKYMALLLAALLFFWMQKKQKKTPILIYTTGMTAACIFPISAVGLMMYQTKFYNYEWIWNLVPATIMIAAAGTIWLSEKIQHIEQKHTAAGDFEWRQYGQLVLLILGCMVIVWLCGRMGRTLWDTEEQDRGYQDTKEILLIITENGQNKDIVMVAPQEVMEYARELDGSIQLLYGRNMWEASLNGYSYDTYSQETVDVFQWMCRLEQTSAVETDSMEENDADILEAAASLQTLRAGGVNTLLLPETISEEELAYVEELCEQTARKCGKYYWLEVHEWNTSKN